MIGVWYTGPEVLLYLMRRTGRNSPNESSLLNGYLKGAGDTGLRGIDTPNRKKDCEKILLVIALTP